ncbi:MAG TPA: YiiD C-terminal domain-containing protein [Gammaproteobacteria bacterium]|jgi:thioesterase domain-containing protein
MSTFLPELESAWRQGIPLVAAMGVEIAGYSEGELVLRAPLAPNINVHGTGFAGSLYAICTLAGWGALWLQMRARGRDAHIVLSESQIDYRRAVEESIVCRCRFDADTQAPNLAQLERTGSGLFPLTATIDSGGRGAVRFEGEYAVKLRVEPSAAPSTVTPSS